MCMAEAATAAMATVAAAAGRWVIAGMSMSEREVTSMRGALAASAAAVVKVAADRGTARAGSGKQRLATREMCGGRSSEAHALAD